MVGLGAVAVVITVRRGEPRAIWFALGYFTAMEALQAASYAVIDDCGSSANRTITILSYLHIAFQPLLIDAFAMTIAPAPVPVRIQRLVYGVAAGCSALILLRLAPVDWLGPCLSGEVMCGPAFCVVSGNWHIAWQVPLNRLYNPLSDLIGYGLQFPDYFVAVFVLPLI